MSERFPAGELLVCIGGELPVGHGYKNQPGNDAALNEHTEYFQDSAWALQTSARVSSLWQLNSYCSQHVYQSSASKTMAFWRTWLPETLGKNANARAPPQTYGTRISGWGPGFCMLHNLSRWFLNTSKFEESKWEHRQKVQERKNKWEKELKVESFLFKILLESKKKGWHEI